MRRRGRLKDSKANNPTLADDQGDKDFSPEPACRRGLALSCSLIPVSAALIVTATIFTCYLLTESQEGFIAKGLWFPAISFLGSNGEAKLVYQIGFSLTGLLLLGTLALANVFVVSPLASAGSITPTHTSTELRERTREEKDIPPLEFESKTLDPNPNPNPNSNPIRPDYQKSSELASRAINMGLLSALGVIVQGVFVLEIPVNYKTYIHWIGALMFIMGAQAHAQEIVELYTNTASNSLRYLLQGSLGWKKACQNAPSVFFVVPVGMQVIRLGMGMDTGALLQNSMGVIQWGLVFSYILFFVSYGYDIFIVIHRSPYAEKGHDE